MTQVANKVLVIGGAGYIGSVLTEMLLDHGRRVTVFDRMLFGEEPLKHLKDRPELEIIRGDLRDVSAVSRAVRGKDAVVLLAALVGEPACDRDPAETVDVNWLGTKTAAEAARYYGVPRFLFASTDSCYGIQEGVLYEDSPLNPISLYAELKARMEKELLAYSDDRFHPTILRLATVYGLSPRMRFDLIINILTMHAVISDKIRIYGGKQWRPLVHVRDVAQGFLAALDAPVDQVKNGIFNIGSNDQNYRIGELGELVVREMPGIQVETIEQPPDLRDYHVNFDKAEKTLGYRAQVSVAEGIREIAEAIRSGRLADPAAPRYRNA